MLQTAVLPTPFRWQQRIASPLARRVDISVSAARLAFYLWRDRTVKRSTEERQRRAQWLSDTLLNLGPTFIKIGQALSTRADLLPLEYVRALSRLQDQVPGFDSAQAIAIIESELGAPLETLYKEFERTPIAAASLGQVHRARLHSGEEVVVKVQRPGLDRLFEMDFRVLGQLVQWLSRFPMMRHYDLFAIHQEFSEILFREIDYIQEAMNADRFRHNFQDHDRICVPQVYPRFTTQRVLTMEYMPGVKVNDRQKLLQIGLDPKEINHLGICAYLKQLLQDGFYQADPHPGNMAVSLDGRLIFYDFGMMAEVMPINRNQMIQAFFGVLRKDTDQVLQTMIDMELIEPMSDMMPLRRIVGLLVERFAEKPVEMQAFKSLRNELYALFEQQPFRLPAKLTFVIKALTTLDGVARDLDPQYNMLAAVKPFVKSLAADSSQGTGLTELARQAKGYLSYQLAKPNSTQRSLQRLEERLELGELQVQVRSPESERSIKLLQLTAKALLYACITGFASITGAILLVGAYPGGAIAAFTVAAVAAVMLLRSLVRLLLRERIERIGE
jgi:predicted unusual protein kinase regulating ubiquinone biosynthesis (AarF/ABC1/UbiB family)